LAADTRHDAVEPAPAGAQVRAIVQILLRSGLAIACVLMAVGLVVEVAGGHHSAATVRLFDIGSADLGDRLMALGMLALAATPAVRVVALLVMWSLEGDRRHAAVAAVVLLVLGVAILVGHG